MLKKLFIAFVIGLTVLSLSGCLKGGNSYQSTCTYDPCSVAAPDSQIQKVKDYLASKNINATQHCSGLFYVIDNPGTGAQPTVCSTIGVTYKGTLTNDSTFGQGTTEFPLASTVRGWANGIPLIKAGGRIHLYIPPALGYGTQQNGHIPPNSILIFDVSLLYVQ
jgi:FKBP-type peptidyl-prolyl cis-trans isomerase FkpA